MHGLIQDWRFAIRQLRRSPGFTVLALLMLALGTGANALMFSLIDSVLVRPLPYPDAAQLADLHRIDSRGYTGSLSMPDFEDYRKQSQSFSAMAAYVEHSVSSRLPSGEAVHLDAVAGSANLFAVLQANAALGRTFLNGEDQSGKPCIAILSAELWRQHFASEGAVAGKRMTVDGEPCVIVGVMPAGFEFPSGVDDGIWTTLRPHPKLLDRGTQFLKGIARLKSGVTLRTAQSELDTISRRLAAAYPESNKDTRAGVTSYQDSVTGRAAPALLALLGAVGILLLIVCANIANLQLARALGRRREIAVRAALGARRFRLGRQLLVENLVLALAGGGFGLLLAYDCLDLLKYLAGPAIPRIDQVRLYPEVCAALLGIAALTGIVVGMAPMLHAVRQDLQRALRDSALAVSAGRQMGIRDVLVVGQLSLAIMLLACSGLMLRTLLHLLGQDRGFSTERILTLNTALSGNSYKGQDLAAAIYRPELDAISRIAGVKAAGFITYLPLGHGFAHATFKIAGRSDQRDGRDEPSAALNAASEDYFRALQIPLLRGRFFEAGDGLSRPPVVIINDALASRYFHDQDPIGRQITFDDSGTDAHSLTIVGIVRGSRQQTLADPPQPEIYLCYRQIPPDTVWSEFLLRSLMAFVIRTEGDPTAVARAVRAAIHGVDPGQTIFNVATMEEVVSTSLRSKRLTAILLGVFAMLALTIASAGLYAVLSYTVGQRKREIAVRIALGAGREEVARMILRRAGWLYAAGSAIGLAGAAFCGRLLGSVLTGVRPWDPFSLAATAGTLAVITLAAAWAPAHRAAALEPMQVLRAE